VSLFGPKSHEKSVMSFAQNQTVKGHYALNFNTLKQVRELIYDSFERGADALFNLCDARLVRTASMQFARIVALALL
jgi:hypothetical protein